MTLLPAVRLGWGGPAAQAGTPRPRPDGLVSAEEWQAYGDELAQRAAAGAFSGAVLVAKGGRPVLERGFGMADRTRGVANTTQTKFDIASLGKMFTGVATARLVAEGALAFDDTIGAFALGFPPEVDRKVTVHHLLTNTSGMGDAALLRRADGPEPPHTLVGLMARIVTEPLRFEPGSRFGYSNDGFIVLGAIVERVSGCGYADYVREHVFHPAGMTDTDVRVYRPSEIPTMARGYTLAGQTGQAPPAGPPPGPPLGPGQGSTAPPGPPREHDEVRIGNPSGGGYSTVVDLLRFAQALTSHELLSPALTETLLAGKVAAGRPGPGEDGYAYGFSDRRINGVRIVGHNGGSPGYEGQLDLYPDGGYTVVLLTNQDQVLAPALRESEEMLTR
jgi:CubicO group peptidase (beta-lactamase class C family)